LAPNDEATEEIEEGWAAEPIIEPHWYSTDVTDVSFAAEVEILPVKLQQSQDSSESDGDSHSSGISIAESLLEEVTILLGELSIPE
jgi:hypothetical protein